MEELLKEKLIEIQKEIEVERKQTDDTAWLHVLQGKKYAYEELLLEIKEAR